MNAKYIQNLRYKLQKRVRRLRSSDQSVYRSVLKQFWGFLQGQPMFVGVMDDLKKRQAHTDQYADRIFNGEGLVVDSELEHAAISCFLLEKCAASDKAQCEMWIGRQYSETGNANEMLEGFNYQFLDPFYEYLDEQLDDHGAIFAFLRKYKHKCEWFQRDHLLQIWQDDTRHGEKRLGLHLLEYLHEQGIDIAIEPWSASGEADLVALQSGEEPLIADVKVFTASGSASKIAAGFRQLYTYTLDYNEPIGYLVIFNVSGKDLRFALTDQMQSTPFIIHNHKTIFFISIDISQYEETASGRGQLQTINITESELVNMIDAAPED